MKKRTLRNPTDFGKSLRGKQAAVLKDLIAGSTLRGAAKNAGVHFTTVYDWLRTDRNFAEALATARRDTFSAAKDLLKVASERATSILIQLLENDDPNIRRQAAIALLDRAFKVVDGEDLEKRLRTIEEIVGVRPLPLRAATEPEDREPS